MNDLLFRNTAGEHYNINDRLSKIKAKSLIIHVKNDQWLRYILAEEAAKQVPGAKLASFESPLAHYAVFRAPNVVKEDVTAFFKEIGMQ